MASRHPAWSADAGERVLHALHEHDRLVLPALQALQAEFGYVDPEAVPLVASFLNVSVAETHGVLTFYHELRTTPPAEITVALCSAEACQASGSRELRAEVEQGIAPVGGRSADGEVDVVERQDAPVAARDPGDVDRRAHLPVRRRRACRCRRPGRSTRSRRGPTRTRASCPPPPHAA